MCEVMQERAIGLLNAGMFIRAVSVWLNVHHSTKARLRERLQQTQRATNRPQRRRPRATIPAQEFYVRLVNLSDRFQPATGTANETVCVSNRRISAQTVCNCLRKAEMHAPHPHRKFDLTEVQRRNHLA
jgi:hypothetical protein